MSLLVPITAFVKPSLYKDSVALMRIAEDIQSAATGVQVTLLMGTPANKELLAEAKLLAAALERAGPADLMVVISAPTDAQCNEARHEVDARLTAPAPTAGGSAYAPIPRRAMAMALGTQTPRLAQISVPGPYAAAEAMKALKAGMHVFLFSDNVPVAQEVAVKQLARRKGLLVMGPDCGTAIIAGVPLGFANVVRRGRIGLVAASGTGLQELTTQIHRLGQGVSHAIGTGGRDTSAEVGGLTMLAGVEALAADAATAIIVIISKPPAASVTREVVSKLNQCGKPAVVLFLGAQVAAEGSIHPAGTLYEAAAKAVTLAGGSSATAKATTETQASMARQLAGSQRYVRALFSGGTYCSEAQVIWREQGIAAYSNAPLDKARALADPRVSREHSAIDLGDDAFTVGKPHPMIDPSTRIERIAAEANDPSTAVILLDIVLGYGAHADPAGALVPAIRDAQTTATRGGRHLPVVAFVCGTEDDPQRRFAQEEKLCAAGALVAPSSTAAARLAGAIVADRR